MALLISIIRDNPQADRTAHQNLLRHLLLSPGYEDFLDAVIAQWSSINYKTARSVAFPPTAAELKERAVRRKELRAREDAAVKKAKGLIASRLFDFVMPNGKPLHDCTGGECMEAGGLFAKIGERVGKNNVVGHVLTVADIVQIAQ